ncbi:uncharacterized protein LOC122086231 [Macadamia integrifolia]|uniref:uncharacterized protein LOC122086231 n=1 Tax=Macadamia integrifolia TaxID=60698 RepID=UPI001C4F052C|nr:uncharacterized protein LOC122086231 [Macadamia integrifolia]XP_042511006.1 uncharacterized protein LOC122086231 [Macadamia integrifolia]
MDGEQPLTCLSCNAPLSLPNISPSLLYNLCLHCLHNSQPGQLYLSEPPPPMEAAAAVNYVNVSPLPWLRGENANFMPTYINSVSTTVMPVVQRTAGTGVWILAHAANVLQRENLIGRVDNTIDLTLSLQGTGGTGARFHADVANEVQREVFLPTVMMGREDNPIDLTLRLATAAEEANH